MYAAQFQLLNYGHYGHCDFVSSISFQCLLQQAILHAQIHYVASTYSATSSIQKMETNNSGIEQR